MGEGTYYQVVLTISSLLRQITPPVLRSFLKGLVRKNAYIWKGIYSRYQDVPATGDGFNGDYWITRTRSYTEEALTASRESRFVPSGVVGEHMILPLLASLVCNSRGRVNILDFGGGMGIAYIHTVSSLVNCQSINFHIVESQRVTEEGMRLFEHDKRVHFHSTLPAHLADLDIVHMSSALQYVEDYSSLLKTLAGYNAKYFLFVKLSAGDFPTYATAQKNVPGSTLPYWFINAREVVELMATCGYSLIYKSALEQEYDQDNFPQEYRLGRTSNLLFSRN